MKKYMVISKDEDGKMFSAFFDDIKKAEKYRMDAECGLGLYAEVYERSKKDGYKLLYC